MSTELSNALGYAWIAFGLIAFLTMATGFARLFRTAWKSHDRKAMLKKVVNVSPRRNQEWPNKTKEADMIAFGALLGFVFFLSLLTFALCSRTGTSGHRDRRNAQLAQLRVQPR